MSLLVVGAGISGHGAARLARRRGLEVVIYDRDPGAVSDLAEQGFTTVAGDWNPALLRGKDAVVLSPGVPEGAPPVQDALAEGLPTWSEMEFAFRHASLPVVAVTGTNGKTTTTALIADIISRSGRKAVAAGNIGTALSDVVDEPWDLLVVEASSFQLRFIDTFHAGTAVVLNVAEDHLDWHGSVEAYRQAKARICENQQGSDLLVFDADDEGAARVAAAAGGRTLPVSGRRLPPGGGGVAEGSLHLGGLAVPVEGLAVSDPAFLVDLVAAGCAALETGADPAAVTAGLLAFRPGAHRRESLSRWRGVLWVDDSKATNPHAALAAVGSYPSVVLVAGGRSKGLDVTGLARHPNLKALVAMGEARDEMLAAASVPAVPAETMEEAVRSAAGLASAGDTVLLAPGCASFDMFDSYVARGEAFAAAVRKLEVSPWPR